MRLLKWLVSVKHYELKIVLATLAVLISLPIVSVVVAATSASAVVGNALVSLNPVTHIVEVFDPNGQKTTDLQLSTVWPVRGYVSDEFGTYSQLRKELNLGPHTGIDIANAMYTPIRAAGDGKVIWAGRSPYDPAWIVIIAHSSRLVTWYAHIDNRSHPPAVHAGEYVAKGEIIAYEGMTGWTTGPHLHWAVQFDDNWANPRLFLPT